MNNSSFDLGTFLDASTTEALTRRPPIPAGKELLGTIGEPKPRQAQGKQDPTKVYTFLDLPIEFDLSQDPAVHQLLGVDKVILTYGFPIDLSPSGGIDVTAGKNGRLRQLREALGLNVPGQPFSPRMLQGRMAKFRISHREYDNEMFDQVDSIVKA